MKFCPNCGKKLVLTKGPPDKNTSMQFRCPQCNHAEDDPILPQGPKITEPDTPDGAVVILDEGQELRTTPTERADCPKCHNNLAFVWQVQTRGGDEGATQFFRCTKCNFTWRLYT
jgi:DNA-directed RNA polymerase subunit M